MAARKVLVIGSGGYVGRRLMPALRSRGLEAIGADLSLGSAVTDEVVDIRFPAQSMALIHRVEPQAVICLSYLLTAATAVSAQAALDTNIIGFNGVLEASAVLGVPHVIYASTNAVYGDQSDFGDEDVAEEAPTRPRSLYGHMKRFNEAMAEHYNRSSPTRFVGLRLASLHGRGKTGIFNPFDLVVDAQRHRADLTLPWSAEHEFSFLHVDDAAGVFAVLAEAESSDWTLYNSPGERLTMGALAALIGPEAGLSVDVETPGRLLAHVMRMNFDRLSTEFPISVHSASDWLKLELAGSTDGP